MSEFAGRGCKAILRALEQNNEKKDISVGYVISVDLIKNPICQNLLTPQTAMVGNTGLLTSEKGTIIEAFALQAFQKAAATPPVGVSGIAYPSPVSPSR